MTTLLLRTRTGASAARTLRTRDDCVPSERFIGRLGGFDGVDISRTLAVLLPVESSGPSESAREIAFWQQKQAFRSIPASALLPYTGRFVISLNGEIIDHDHDLTRLTRRWTEQHGGVQVYITRIGGEMEVDIDTPFLD